MGERILIVDDDLSLRELLPHVLRREGYTTEVAASAEQALQIFAREPADLVLTDLNMPGMTGIDLLRELKARAAAADRDVEVVLLTAFGSHRTVVEAMREGAADYVTKPFDNSELVLVLRKALANRTLAAENVRLKKELGAQNNPEDLIGQSEPMARVGDLIRRIKDARINCLIQGESGTGKERVARAIHYTGSRKDGPFVPVNCGAISQSLVESELFGYKKGAFTGAVRDKVGFLQAAHKGTLFLDEVNSLPQPAQVSLLRALQERRFTPVGDVKEIEVDIRLIAASNTDLEAEVEKGRFREDLFYRLNVVQINLPALRHRPEDIPDLVRHFVTRLAADYHKTLTVSPDALALLVAWPYPGNVRELQNVVERAVALCAGNQLTPEDLPERMRQPKAVAVESAGAFPPEGVDLDAILNEAEKKWLVAALKVADGNKTRAAQLLNVTFRSFRYRLAKHEMGGDD